MTKSAIVPMTIEQFRQSELPETYELHGGEPVDRGNPTTVHRQVQRNIEHVFDQVFRDAQVIIEMTFEIAATGDGRSADVGVTTADRWQAALRQGALDGAPEIVVEVLSAANYAMQLEEYQSLCFDHETLIFLVVNAKARAVQVRRKGTQTVEFRHTDASLAIEIWGQTHTIAVRDFFVGLPENLRY